MSALDDLELPMETRVGQPQISNLVLSFISCLVDKFPSNRIMDPARAFKRNLILPTRDIHNSTLNDFQLFWTTLDCKIPTKNCPFAVFASMNQLELVYPLVLYLQNRSIYYMPNISYLLPYTFHFQTVSKDISDMYNLSCKLQSDFVEDGKAYKSSASEQIL